MLKKPKKQISISSLKKKADRLLQELGRQTYDRCLVCGKEMSCLHHYYPKSTALHLRYDLKNCIPLCVGCHFSHHNGNPDIHNKINEIMGHDWVVELKDKKINSFIMNRKSIEEYIKLFESLL